MAAPHVTAVASLLWQKDKTKSNAFIKELLFASANTSISGAKVVDAKFALENDENFATNYTENHTNIIENNNSDIETLTDDTVEALWGGANHESTANNNSYIGSYLGSNDIANNTFYSDSYITDVQPGSNYPERITMLNNLDSAVCMSDVFIPSSFAPPDDSTGYWKRGYVSSY